MLRVEPGPAPGPALVIVDLGASSATSGSTSAKIAPALGKIHGKIALAHGQIGVTRGRIRRKIGPSGVKIVGRTFVILSVTTIPGLTSGKTIRMHPVGP